VPKTSSIRSAVSIEHQLVTDGTDGQTQAHGWYRGCIASRGKNRSLQLDVLNEHPGIIDRSVASLLGPRLGYRVSLGTVTLAI